MQGKKRGRVPLETKTKGSQSNFSTHANNVGLGPYGKQCSSDDSESFYKKLSDLLESSGLTLIFDVRETLLDLYLFYSEVTRRGGYHQITRDRKWEEVASALKLEGSNVKLAAQLEKMYALVLYQFEQLYHYRKRKSESLRDITGGEMVTKMWPMPEQQKVLLLEPSNEKQVKKRRGAPRPRGHRNAYQIFLKQECARLRACDQTSVGGLNLLHMAIDSWRNMSEIERQPYVEESKKEKERFMEKMNTQNEKEEDRPDLDGDYHVTVQPDADNYLLIDYDGASK